MRCSALCRRAALASNPTTLQALGEQTPREAIQTPEGRQQVVDLLDTYDRNERRMAGEQGREPLSFDFLRREVGLLD